MHAVVLLAHCLSSLLRHLCRARVVRRPAEEREENACRCGNEEWPALFQILPANDAGRKQIYLHRTNGDAHISKRIKKLDRQYKLLVKELAHVRHACAAAAKKDANGPISLLLRAV